MLASNIAIPGSNAQVNLLPLASCWYRLWEAAVKVQLTGFLLPDMGEDWIELLASTLPSITVGICGVNQQMEPLSLPLK